MKKSCFALLALVFIAFGAYAASGPAESPVPSLELETSLSDILPTQPFWLKVDTAFICPPDNGPYTCTRDRDCQIYFGLPSNYDCINPSGFACGGHCEPC